LGSEIWAGGAVLKLPPFNADGLLPPGDYEMSLEELQASMLIEGPGESYPNWDSEWRLRLVKNLGTMVGQLWEIGVLEIFINGSFVEDKEHPNDIDGYFECLFRDFTTGRLQRELNKLDPYKVWTWEPGSRSPYRNQPKWQLPMWHRYRVELYPHYVDLPIALQRTGIRDEFGNDLHFPAAFRKSRREHKPKGIVKIRH
jgi:hypothetical protein